jgi:hypothetical protein
VVVTTFTLTGTGQQLVSQPQVLAIGITANVSNPQQGRANPTNFFQIGMFRLITANGAGPVIYLNATTQRIDCPPGTNYLGYWLETGVTITATEVFSVPTDSARLGAEPDVISTMTPFVLGGASLGPGFGSTTAVQVANRAVLVPFVINQPHTVAAFFYYCVTGGGSNHQDIGVYSNSFSRLCSTGSIVSPTGQAIVAPSGGTITLQPGQYYLAFVSDSATPSFLRLQASLAILQVTGIHEMASAFPLPTSITPALPTGAGFPVFGFSAKSNI